MGSKTSKSKNEKASVSALSNPFSTGGGGVDFEHRVQATFLLALLAEGFSPLLNTPITAVKFQVKRLNIDIDDIVVESTSKIHSSKLRCQIKHGVKLTANETFKEIIASAWSDYNKYEFDKQNDKVVLISGKVANADSIRFIYDQANGAEDAKDFLDRINRGRYSNGTNIQKLNIIRKYLKCANDDQDITDEQLWGFCKVFTILVFDMDYESSVNEFLIRALIASCCKENPSSVWAQLVDFAARCDKSAWFVTLDKIPESIRLNFKNIVPSEENISQPLDFAIDSFWAKLALIGSWNERNDHDKNFLASLLGINYIEIQKIIQENSLQPNPSISFSEGFWHVNNRRSIIKACSKAYFDDDITQFFQLSNDVLNETDTRIQENGEYSIMIPESGSFVHSDVLRNGIIHGLAIICNMSGTQLSCSSQTIAYESAKLLRALFINSSSYVWKSLDSHLPIIAEINPSEYLDCLENQIVNSPQSMEDLFPKNNDNLLFSKNFICSVLWSLEGLAWSDKYFVKSIRLLGQLANLKYDKTNSSNTPINTIISIMLPWHIQTLASKDKQENALKALQQECPKVAWLVIKGLLPHSTRTTGGTHKPRYIVSNIPEEVRISDQEIIELYQYYSHLALALSKEDYSKICDLLSYYDDMDRNTIVEYLSLISTQASDWDDSQKYPFWKEFLNHKEWLLLHTSEELDADMMKLLNSTIEKVCPDDIRYSYRRFYESDYFDYDDEGEFHTKWAAKRNKQETAVFEIYTMYGINSVIEFAKGVNHEAWVALNLGKQLKQDDVKILLKMCFEDKLDRSFFASIIDGYVIANDYNAINQLELELYNSEYISWVLSSLRPSMRLFEIANALLGENVDLYWSDIVIPRFGLDDSVDLNYVWCQLVHQNRFAAAINLFGITAEKCNISHNELQNVLTQAATTESGDKLDPDAVRNLIELLQQSRNISIEEISQVEFIYLPWLDEYSKVNPKALRYRLANEPTFFCELIEKAFKKKHSEANREKLSEFFSRRIWTLIYNFSVVPGTDWDDNYNEAVFCKWIEHCKAWSKAEDREAVVLQTIGNGLSYAKKCENGLVDDFIMRELNKIENEEMRVGYRIGLVNQRGVRWIDPEGKPEYKLAKQYKALSELAESLGYAKFAETLLFISEEYTREAEQHIREHRIEQEARKRENNN